MHDTDDERAERRCGSSRTPHERPETEPDEHDRNSKLERERDAHGHWKLQQDQRTTDDQDTGGMAQPPPRAHTRRVPNTAASGRNGTDGCDVIGIRRMADAERE